MTHIIAVTTHWNHVTKRGAGIEESGLLRSTLFKYTIEMDTTQYDITTEAMYAIFDSLLAIALLTGSIFFTVFTILINDIIAAYNYNADNPFEFC